MPMVSSHVYSVLPNLPDELKPLLRIAYNLWWTWDPDAIALFQRVDPENWAVDHNPVRMLGALKPRRVRELQTDDVFLSHIERVAARLDEYLRHTSWYQRIYGEELGCRIAYFSAEFGLHECLRIYAGGLGVLSGDHFKSTSDLGLPLTGVGLLYQQGYFHQYLNLDGWQQETFPDSDFFNLPVELERDGDNAPLRVSIEYPGREVVAQVWRVQVGRVPLYLLDTNVPENIPEDRNITHQLYGGDLHMRMRQEILLGIGGIRVLEKLGLAPTVCHMNEGHSAFLALERIRGLVVREGLSFADAREAVAASNVFTTHTPVPAGNDAFPPDMMKCYFETYARQLGIAFDEFLGLGRVNPGDPDEPFAMTVLALRVSGFANGVSQLHAKVSRRLWRRLWPGLPPDEVPIIHITNGVHTRSWYADEIARLYDRYLGPKWAEDPDDQRVWQRVDRIPDSELWRAHERLRERLVTFARERLAEQLRRRGAPQEQIREAREVLDPETLTIGFARRFATYKRASLLIRDLERLDGIVNNAGRPMQIIFAGKAHPKDEPGKEMIREIIRFERSERFRRRVVFLEDYDIRVARCLVQGVDVWLNTPRRPLEASGTSGMKVVMNGGIHLSVLDGWWCEGYRGENGWAIGAGEEYEDPEEQDRIESFLLYEILEHSAAPLFYRRGPDGLPRGWIAMMKESMKSLCPFFNTSRMVEEYVEKAYLPSALQWQALSAGGFAQARELAAWRKRVTDAWQQVGIREVRAEGRDGLKVGEDLPVTALVDLGDLEPSDVAVELYYGPLDPRGVIVDGRVVGMMHSERAGGGLHRFAGAVPCVISGRHGFIARVRPHRQGVGRQIQTGLVVWG
ncbi:MAG: alpha-glucan family phosphorylase [Myxococcota bacterium]|nr:alpha-glucan family phosphorylase [Myxococcota bacterium]